MQRPYYDDAMANAMREVDDPLHDPTSDISIQESSAPPSMQQLYAQFKEDREIYTKESILNYKEWWRARMREIGKKNEAKFIEFMTIGNGLCRTQPLKCIDGFPKYEYYLEFLELLDSNGEWGKTLRSHLMTRAMPAMVAKVHTEGKGGFKSKSKSKSMRRRRNRRKNKTNKRRRRHH